MATSGGHFITSLTSKPSRVRALEALAGLGALAACWVAACWVWAGGEAGVTLGLRKGVWARYRRAVSRSAGALGGVCGARASIGPGGIV